ncbi:protease 2 [Tanacetum coccineum]
MKVPKRDCIPVKLIKWVSLMVSYMGMDPMEKCLTKAGLRSWVVAFADVSCGLNKFKSINDFISCGNYLIDEGYVHQNQLAAVGHSAGSLLIADSINMHPRVGVWEAAKYVSRIRESTYSKCSRSIILKTNMARGHFGKGGRSGKCEELAYKYAFLMKVMGEAK